MSIRSTWDIEVQVKRIVIENFKSIKHVELELKPGINILVGPNASGKTNILEALYFLRLALIDYIWKSPYIPYAKLTLSPVDLVYNKDPHNTIKYFIKANIKVYKKVAARPHLLLSTKLNVEFSVNDSTIIPTKFEMQFEDKTVIEIEGSIEGGLLKAAVHRSLLDSLKEKYGQFYEQFVKLLEISVGVSELLQKAQSLAKLLGSQEVFYWFPNTREMDNYIVIEYRSGSVLQLLRGLLSEQSRTSYIAGVFPVNDETCILAEYAWFSPGFPILTKPKLLIGRKREPLLTLYRAFQYLML